MKKLFLVSSLMLFFVTTKAQNVGTDKALGVSLDSYKTYGWMADIDNIPKDRLFVGPGGVLIFNNESSRQNIKEAIRYELSAKGKTLNEGSPDMLVNFMVFEQPGRLRTFNGVTTVNMGADTVRTEDNITYTNFKAGTLLINFTDPKTNKMIWQGYASGILDTTIVKSQAKVRGAVSSIFAEID